MIAIFLKWMETNSIEIVISLDYYDDRDNNNYYKMHINYFPFLIGNTNIVLPTSEFYQHNNASRNPLDLDYIIKSKF